MLREMLVCIELTADDDDDPDRSPRGNTFSARNCGKNNDEEQNLRIMTEGDG